MNTIEKKEAEIDLLIKQIKDKTGFNQEKIAEEIGYTRSYLSQAKKTDSEKLFNALKQYKDKLDNLTPSVDILGNLTISNRVLAEANKTLAEAHQIIAKNNDELLQLTKLLINSGKQPSTAQQPLEEGGQVASAEQEIRSTGRTGSYEMAGKGARSGSSVKKDK